MLETINLFIFHMTCMSETPKKMTDVGEKCFLCSETGQIVIDYLFLGEVPVI